MKNTCKNKAGVVFGLGDTVRLTQQAFQVQDPIPPTRLGRRITKGKITMFLNGEPGWALVEPKLGGFHTWNVDDLRHTV
jgi:hypothetical protein